MNKRSFIMLYLTSLKNMQLENEMAADHLKTVFKGAK